MQNLNAQKHSNFEAFASASYPINSGKSYNVAVEIDAPDVLVMVAWGANLDASDLQVKTVTKTESVPVVIPSTLTNGNIYIFTFLKPQKDAISGNLWFGAGASANYDPQTPVGMLRFPSEPIAGVSFPEIPPANIPLPHPIKSHMSTEALSEELQSYSTGPTHYILNGGIQESAQILLLDVVGSSVNYYWSSEHQAGVSSSNIHYNSNKFACLVTATPPTSTTPSGEFYFFVGDPRKDAKVTIGEGI